MGPDGFPSGRMGARCIPSGFRGVFKGRTSGVFKGALVDGPSIEVDGPDKLSSLNSIHGVLFVSQEFFVVFQRAGCIGYLSEKYIVHDNNIERP